MNRIREIRSAKNLTQAELARRVGTTQPQIDRLEKSNRRLTEDWMRRLAEALDVTPADLISAPTVAEFREEATAYEPPPAMKRMWLQLASASKVFMTIGSDSLENLGIRKGDVRLFDTSDAAVAGVKTGDVVIAQLFDTRELLKGTTILRQYVEPGLLVTNRSTTNMAFMMVNPNFEAHIRMVMVPEQDQPEAPPAGANGASH